MAAIVSFGQEIEYAVVGGRGIGGIVEGSGGRGQGGRVPGEGGRVKWGVWGTQEFKQTKGGGGRGAWFC